MLTGRVPFRGETDVAVAHAARLEPRRRTRARCEPAVSEALAGVVHAGAQQGPGRQVPDGRRVRGGAAPARARRGAGGTASRPALKRCRRATERRPPPAPRSRPRASVARRRAAAARAPRRRPSRRSDVLAASRRLAARTVVHGGGALGAGADGARLRTRRRATASRRSPRPRCGRAAGAAGAGSPLAVVLIGRWPRPASGRLSPIVIAGGDPRARRSSGGAEPTRPVQSQAARVFGPSCTTSWADRYAEGLGGAPVCRAPAQQVVDDGVKRRPLGEPGAAAHPGRRT